MRECHHLMSVPHIEALELPFSIERTTQKPHAEYAVYAGLPALTRRPGGFYIST